ncbi:MAG: ABC transporter permease [Planctomycetota bacterium]
MDFFADGFRIAWAKLVGGDADTWSAIETSLLCTTLGVALAFVLAVPYAAWLGQRRPRTAPTQVFLLRVGTFVPTVVVGLLLYGLLSRRGLLGSMDLLYTRTAIVVGQALLAFPLIATLVQASTASLDVRAYETARTLGAGPLRALGRCVAEVRESVIAAFLLAYARGLSELGVTLAVGGNLRLRTRTLSSTITLELSRGEFGAGLACGIILVVLAVAIALFASRLGKERVR